MLTGFLRILVLESLLHEARTGYQLMELIEQHTGKRPSPGSIYPLLKDLNRRGFITHTTEHKKKLYSLTQAGKRRIRQIEKERSNMREGHKRIHDLLDDLTGAEHKEPVDICRPELLRNSDLLEQLKKNLSTLVRNGLFEKHESQIRGILKETNTKLKRLR